MLDQIASLENIKIEKAEELTTLLISVNNTNYPHSSLIYKL